MGIIILFAILVILFIIWQFKTIMKYSFKYDNIKIDTEHNFLIINNKKIKFVDINYITVEELEQPSILERTFSRGGHWAYISEITIHLKDSTTKKCTFNTKGRLYNTLKKLEQYVRIEADIDTFKNTGFSYWLTILVLITCLISVFCSLFIR